MDMIRRFMERMRKRAEIRRVARSHHHGGGGPSTTARDTPSAARARGDGELYGRQGGFDGG